MDMHPAILACCDREGASIRDEIDACAPAVIHLQSVAGKEMARFVAIDLLDRAGQFTDETSATRYQILLARLYEWQKLTA